MDAFVLLVFVMVYLGMLLGRVPGLALDRTGVALLGAIAVVAGGRLTAAKAWQAIDTPTIGLLLGLLVLFAGLFVVNHAMAESGNLEQILRMIRSVGIEPREPATLFGLSVVLSNLVSNVPATMLLLPLADHPLAGPILALSSTLAGNLLVVGSIANIIVVDQAERLGIRIGWAEHARIGVPVTLVTLFVAAGWLYLLA